MTRRELPCLLTGIAERQVQHAHEQGLAVSLLGLIRIVEQPPAREPKADPQAWRLGAVLKIPDLDLGHDRSGRHPPGLPDRIKQPAHGIRMGTLGQHRGVAVHRHGPRGDRLPGRADNQLGVEPALARSGARIVSATDARTLTTAVCADLTD